MLRLLVICAEHLFLQSLLIISVVNLTQLLSALIALRPPAASAVVHLLNMEEALVLLVQLTAFLL